MDDNINADERRELAEIYNNLSQPLQKQLLTIAKVMETTRDITLTERKKRKPYTRKSESDG